MLLKLLEKVKLLEDILHIELFYNYFNKNFQILKNNQIIFYLFLHLFLYHNNYNINKNTKTYFY